MVHTSSYRHLRQLRVSIGSGTGLPDGSRSRSGRGTGLAAYTHADRNISDNRLIYTFSEHIYQLMHMTNSQHSRTLLPHHREPMPCLISVSPLRVRMPRAVFLNNLKGFLGTTQQHLPLLQLTVDYCTCNTFTSSSTPQDPPNRATPCDSSGCLLQCARNQ